MKYLTIENIALATGIIILLIGLWGALSQKNLYKIIISFSVFDTGLNILIVSLGYMKGRTAPIVDGETVNAGNILQKAIDPVPQALVLTAIVIGFGVTALLLVYALKLNKQKKSLDINHFDELKW